MVGSKVIFVFIAISLSGFTVYGAACSSLFANASGTSLSTNIIGAQFLHQRNQGLQLSRPVSSMAQRTQNRTGQRLQKPDQRISNWLNHLEQVSKRADRDPAVLNRLKNAYFRLHVIKPNEVPQSYFDLQVRIARERGHGHITIDAQMRSQLTEVLVKDQQKSLETWVEYLISKDSSSYPMWAKFWAFQGIVKLSTYNKETHSFGNRDKSTVAPFAELNREALAYVMDAVVKKLNKESLDQIQDPAFLKLLDGMNFGKMYARALALSKTGSPGELLKTTEGRWIVYSKGSDHMPLVRSLEGKNTGWCTAGESTAKSQIERGDFHVYYSLDQFGKPTIPRVAIRMEDKRIAEVRGIEKTQNLDSDISKTNIVTQKMDDFGQEGKLYQKKAHDMAVLTEIDSRNRRGQELTKDDLRFLYELDHQIDGFGYGKDPRIYEIISKRDKKKDISLLFNVLEGQVTIGSSPINEILSGKYKIHFGDIRIPRDQRHLENVSLPTMLTIGQVYFDNVISVRNIQFSKEHKGDIYLDDLTMAEGLKLPTKVYGDVKMQSLKSSKGAEFPDIIYGKLDLSAIERIERPQDLKLPRFVKGQLVLSGLKFPDNLTLPEKVGSVDLTGLTSIRGIKFPLTIDEIYFQKLRYYESLEFPVTINRNLRIPNISFDEYSRIKIKPTVHGAIVLRDKRLGIFKFGRFEFPRRRIR